MNFCSFRSAGHLVCIILLVAIVTLAGDRAAAQSGTCQRTAEETGQIPPETVCALEAVGWKWLGFIDDGSQAHLFEDADGNRIDIPTGSFTLIQNLSRMEQSVLDPVPGPKTINASGRNWDLLAVMLGDRSNPSAVAAFEKAEISLPAADYVAPAVTDTAPVSRIADVLDDLLDGRTVMLDQSTLIAALTGANFYVNGCGITPNDPLRGILRGFNVSAVSAMSTLDGYANQARTAIDALEDYGLPACSELRGVTYLNTLSDSLLPSFRAMSDTAFMQGCRAGNRPAACNCAFTALSLYHDNLADSVASDRLFGNSFTSLRAIGAGACQM